MTLCNKEQIQWKVHVQSGDKQVLGIQGMGDSNCGLRARGKKREMIQKWCSPQKGHQQHTDAEQDLCAPRFDDWLPLTPGL